MNTLALGALSETQVVSSLTAWRHVRRELHGDVGFVPTMGALHAGHVSLLERSLAQNPNTVLSIYLNPTQFNNPDDLEKYPATLAADLEIARSLGVTAVITPTYDEIYADGFRYQVAETELSRELCGEHRPGHFTGVLTVVMKLLNIVRPSAAYFGEKDFQQYQLIQQMANAFFMDVDIVPCPTVRDEDGLALSSRNANLDAPGRQRAPELYRQITSSKSDDQIVAALAERGFLVDYIVSREGRRYAAAVLECGDRSVRLIDNVALNC